MKRILLIVVAALSLSGCTTINVFDARWIQTPDGGQVLCVNNNDAGIDCNWEGYNRK